MTAVAEGLSPARTNTVSRRAEAYARSHYFDRPTLVVDTEQVAERYRALKAGLGRAELHYAVKANPERAIIARLHEEGCRFDAASARRLSFASRLACGLKMSPSAIRSKNPPISPSPIRSG